MVYGREEYSKTENPSRDRREKKAESGRYHVATEGEKCQNLTGKPQPCGDTQINRN